MPSMPGKLFLVATPIGNLKDITLRALEVLKSVDCIACEDTRHSQKLLHTYEIKKPLLSLHEHNEIRRIPEIIERLQKGENIALISDAGTPLISDPGFPLVRAVLAAEIAVEAIPGSCAAINALVMSGLPPDRFLFVGFLPNRSAVRKRKLTELNEQTATLIFYESTHRIEKFLADAREILGPRPAVLFREMTKKFEEVVRGTLETLGTTQRPRSWKGEFVLVVQGRLSKATG